MGEGGGAEGEGEAGAGSFDVEALVALRHDRKGRVEFLVRWKTYDATHDTWVSLLLRRSSCALGIPTRPCPALAWRGVARCGISTRRSHHPA